MQLIERQDLIERLRALVLDAKVGNGRVVAVRGEAGVGKSALVRALADWVGAGAEARVLWGACEALSTPEPLGPMLEIAAGMGWDLRSAIGRHGRTFAFSEMLQFLGRRDSVTLLVVEDLHWADEATVDFIRFLGRRIAGSRVLLLLTTRDDSSARTILRKALSDIPPENVVRIDVPLLTERAVSALAAAGNCDAAAIYRLTAGNAFYVAELIRNGGSNELPASVTDAVLARADRLSAQAREALDVISIFPRRAEVQLINAMLGRNAFSMIEECEAQGLLMPTDGACAFRHEVARRAIEGALTLVRRRLLNAQALNLLSDGEAVATRLAHHAREANDAAAIRTYAPLAGEEATRLGAHREAAEHFATALAHADSFAIAERVVLYERFAFECHLVGRTKDAIGAQTAALELHRLAGDRRREGDGLRWLSRLSYLDGRRGDADRYGREARMVLESLAPGAELAMAYSNQSQLAMLASDADMACHYGEKAVTLVADAALDRSDILCHVHNNMGAAMAWRDPALGRRQLDRSLEIAQSTRSPEHVARAYTNRGWLELNALALSDAKAWLEAGIAYCIERDLDTWRDYMRALLAEVHLRQGRWDEAATTAHLVTGNPDVAPLALYPANLVLAKLRTRRGDPAGDLLKGLADYLQTGMELQRLAPYATLMAERAWLGVASQEAAASLLTKARSMSLDLPAVAEIIWWQHMLELDDGHPDQSTLTGPLSLQLEGSWEGAAQAWQSIGAPYDEALSLLIGDGAAVRRALGILEGLGATATEAKVREQMRRRGVRIRGGGPRASTRANGCGLTRRQLDVLRLVDEGRSNSQIANALFISPKTVDHHLTAILAKLDARSRGEAAALARGLGLLAKENERRAFAPK